MQTSYFTFPDEGENNALILTNEADFVIHYFDNFGIYENLRLESVNYRVNSRTTVPNRHNRAKSERNIRPK